MVADSIFQICLPVLKDDSLNEEEKTDKLEAFLGKEAALTGRALQETVLAVLWRYRDATFQPTTSPSSRPILPRRGSPAPWQVPRAATPLASPSLGAASPASSHGFFAPPVHPRGKQATASPFSSPRPSPRLAMASPIPHSPSLNTYEFSDLSAPSADYGDYGSDNVDWLVNDDDLSRPTSSSATSAFESNLSPAAAPWIQPQQSEMSPYDMLRSILGESKSDEEIEVALETNGYDLSATITAFMGAAAAYEEPKPQTLPHTSSRKPHSVQPIPIGPKSSHAKSPVICKYWLANGSCLRSDCRFSHEFGNHICKYWIMGNCLAGDTCVFSHDPSSLMANMNLGSSHPASESSGGPSFQVQDYDTFPALQPTASSWTPQGTANSRGFGFNAAASPRSHGSRPSSRPTSRSATPSLPQVDDTEAFPALGSIGPKSARKHHGKRGGHGHGLPGKENMPDMRLSPSPSPGLLRRGLMKTKSYTGNQDQGVDGTIPPPEHIPWQETSEKVNQAYLKARQEAFKHGGLRNKFLQSAAQAWNRNDARAAKALSLRGQSENELMRKAHREAAQALYEAREKQTDLELYADLHGLHPEEGIIYLAGVLSEQKAAVSERKADEAISTTEAGKRSSIRHLYVITGTGHHSKGGKDKIGKAIRAWLSERNFTFREFSVPGDRGNIGGILGVDLTTGTIDPRDMMTGKQDGSENASEGNEKSQEGSAERTSSVDSEQAAAADGERPVMQMRIPTGPKGLRV